MIYIEHLDGVGFSVVQSQDGTVIRLSPFYKSINYMIRYWDSRSHGIDDIRYLPTVEGSTANAFLK